MSDLLIELMGAVIGFMVRVYVVAQAAVWVYNQTIKFSLVALAGGMG
jgi:hypothetical protein